MAIMTPSIGERTFVQLDSLGPAKLADLTPAALREIKLYIENILHQREELSLIEQREALRQKWELAREQLRAEPAPKSL